MRCPLLSVGLPVAAEAHERVHLFLEGREQ
jgi:hypothetical protein